MKASFSRCPYVSYISFALIAAAMSITASCGAGGGTSSPNSGGTTPPTPTTKVALQISSTGNDKLTQYNVGIESVLLADKDGNQVTLWGAPVVTGEFIHLNGTAEPIGTVAVPEGTYTSAQISIAGSQATCVTLLPSGEFVVGAFNGPSTAIVNLPSPITVAGTNMGIDMDLQVSKSASISNCNESAGASYSITPTFTLTPFALASTPTTPTNGKLSGINGVARTTKVTNNFDLVLPNGQTLLVDFNQSTVFQTNGFGDGQPVNVDLAVQSAGSFAATRFNVWDNLSADGAAGPLLFVSNVQPRVTMLPRQQEGPDFANVPQNGPLTYQLDNAVYRVSGQFSNVQDLPFTAVFNVSNLVPGQAVFIASQEISSPTGYPAANSVTLIPQTINGTVGADFPDGNFHVYTVKLASYDLFPALAVQQGQANRLVTPDTVYVYVDSDTQLLNSQSLAAGSVLRFNGLIFIDSGMLRMDCGQVSDGVQE